MNSLNSTSKRKNIINKTRKKREELSISATKTIKKDDVILFAKFSGIEIQYEGKPLIVIPEKEVLARIKNG